MRFSSQSEISNSSSSPLQPFPPFLLFPRFADFVQSCAILGSSAFLSSISVSVCFELSRTGYFQNPLVSHSCHFVPLISLFHHRLFSPPPHHFLPSRASQPSIRASISSRRQSSVSDLIHTGRCVAVSLRPSPWFRYRALLRLSCCVPGPRAAVLRLFIGRFSTTIAFYVSPALKTWSHLVAPTKFRLVESKTCGRTGGESSSTVATTEPYKLDGNGRRTHFFPHSLTPSLPPHNHKHGPARFNTIAFDDPLNRAH